MLTGKVLNHATKLYDYFLLISQESSDAIISHFDAISEKEVSDEVYYDNRDMNIYNFINPRIKQHIERQKAETFLSDKKWFQYRHLLIRLVAQLQYASTHDTSARGETKPQLSNGANSTPNMFGKANSIVNKLLDFAFIGEFKKLNLGDLEEQNSKVL